MPTSFSNTLAAVKANLETKEQYVFFTSYTGNCFGPGYSGRAKIQWKENDKYYCRTIYKNMQDKKVTDLTVECNLEKTFIDFRTNRLDTVSTFPEGNIFMDPTTMCYIKVKDNELIFEKTFEQFPLITSKDSTHILYSFLTRLIKEQ